MHHRTSHFILFQACDLDTPLHTDFSPILVITPLLTTQHFLKLKIKTSPQVNTIPTAEDAFDGEHAP